MITSDPQRGLQKAWYLKLNDPLSQRALGLRFSILASGNGFKRVAEVWGILFQRTSSKEVKKTAIKQTYDISAFSAEGPLNIRLGDCELTENHTRGLIQSKGSSIEWDFSMLTEKKSSFVLVPEILSRLGLVKNSIVTDSEELLFSGTTQINGETLQWKEAPGMQGHLQGTRSGHSWAWGHCNTFVNEQGKPTHFIFEGLTARSQLGPIVAPRLSSFYFNYQGREYFFNTLRDSIFIKSSNTLDSWSFQADRDDISFRGTTKTEHKNFAGITYEDINGSLIYGSLSKLADMEIFVYRRGKLEATLRASGTAALELASREKNPYVPLLV